MTRNMLLLHRWLGLIAGLLILVAASTAIALNHQDLFRRPPATGDGPFSRYVLAVANDPHAPQRMLIGTNDGLFRSADAGKTWEEVVLPVPAEGVGAIQFDPRQPGRVYAAFRDIGVYRSDDHGEIWEDVPLPFYPPEGIAIAGLALDTEGRLTLATTAGLFRQAPDGWTGDAAVAKRPETDRLRQVIYDLHDGRFWGAYGVAITDGVSLALIVLVLSGYGLFFGRAIRRRAARKQAPVAPPRMPTVA